MIDSTREQLAQAVLKADADRLPSSSKEEWNNFQRSSLWLDIQNEIRVWLLDIFMQFGNKGNEMKEFRVLQGNMESLQRVLTLPEMLMLRLVDYEMDEKGEDEDGHEVD